MTTLFDPIKLGDWDLPNRIIMAPLTRCRSSEGRVPNAMMAEYYAQRATAGLILSEATSVNPMGVGYPNTPGIWSPEQVEGWKLVTEAVHQKGGKIILQLWHVGRMSDPIYLDGETPLAPSPIKPAGHVSLVRPERPFITPRAITLDEIKQTIEDYRQGAQNAKEAGFDGVEIHGANGYLFDQFLQTSTNQRKDEYGGPIENRARFLLEVTDAAISVWGPGKVGVHIAPACDAHDMGDDDPVSTFTYVGKELGKRNIAFIFAREGKSDQSIGPKIKEAFGGNYIVNQGYTKESGNAALAAGEAAAVSFGVSYIANPDLVERFTADASLNEADPSTFNGEGPKGYTDYPFLQLEATQ